MTLKYEVRVSDQMAYKRHGKLHRVNGPANIWDDGDIYWMQYGKIHRLDGPANIWNIGGIIRYFIKGTEYEKDEYESKIRNNSHLEKITTLQTPSST